MNSYRKKKESKSLLLGEGKEGKENDLDTTDNALKTQYSFKSKRNEKKYSSCFVKEEMSIYGNFHLSLNQGKVRLWTIKQINFPMNRAIFDYGKKKEAPEGSDVPDSKFWSNRYYYFHKFDYGIKMDYESYSLIKAGIQLLQRK